ncbi:unnamed protein product [Arctia plantaginis]|uniref:Uncharacterized protein n=1 Tax=Arctia plantaginis TaxID=874455 RepID=A0A8S1A687_ARCPL|nr:unnamed protein product [Arctia plantaginis]
MAGTRDNTLEGQLTHVIQHHISHPGTEAQVSVHQVQSPAGSGTKRHQIIIDIKQDIDIDELSTRSLAESVMETLGARSAAVYIDNSQIAGENSGDLESLTTVNVIVANDLSQATPSPQVTEEADPQVVQEQAESSGILPGNRIAVDRIVEMTNASTTGESTSTTSSVTTAASTTASGTVEISFLRVFNITVVIPPVKLFIVKSSQTMVITNQVSAIRSNRQAYLK